MSSFKNLKIEFFKSLFIPFPVLFTSLCRYKFLVWYHTPSVLRTSFIKNISQHSHMTTNVFQSLYDWHCSIYLVTILSKGQNSIWCVCEYPFKNDLYLSTECLDFLKALSTETFLYLCYKHSVFLYLCYKHNIIIDKGKFMFMFAKLHGQL